MPVTAEGKNRTEKQGEDSRGKTEIAHQGNPFHRLTKERYSETQTSAIFYFYQPERKLLHRLLVLIPKPLNRMWQDD
jgi:hypothetical protein